MKQTGRRGVGEKPERFTTKARSPRSRFSARPWRAILLSCSSCLRGGIFLPGSPPPCSLLLFRRQQRAGAVEIGGRVDSERDLVHERRVDAHAGFERPELLEALALLERAWRQRDESREGRAAERVDADVMIERPIAGRHA